MPTSPHPARRLGLTLLAVALLSAPLAACGNSNDQASPPPTTTSTAPTSEPTPSIDREAQLERLKAVYKGYQNAFMRSTTMSMYEGDALMRDWATEPQVGRLRRTSNSYRLENEVMISTAEFTAYLAPDPMSMYACMNFSTNKLKNKTTGVIAPVNPNLDKDARVINFTKSDTGKFLIDTVVINNKEARKQCGM